MTKRFYGPATLLPVAILIGGLVFGFGYLLGIANLLESNLSRKIEGGIIIAFITIALILLIRKIHKEFNENPSYRKLEIAGKLDYDLYENGILLRGYTNDISGHIVEGFIPFRNISEIYISNDENKIRRIIEIVRQNAKTNDTQSAEKREITTQTLNNYRKYVWLIINGKPMKMEKLLFKNLPTFNKFIRTKGIVVN